MAAQDIIAKADNFFKSSGSFHDLSGENLHRYDLLIKEFGTYISKKRMTQKRIGKLLSTIRLLSTFGDLYTAYKFTRQIFRTCFGRVKDNIQADIAIHLTRFALELGFLVEAEYYSLEALYSLNTQSEHLSQRVELMYLLAVKHYLSGDYAASEMQLQQLMNSLKQLSSFSHTRKKWTIRSLISLSKSLNKRKDYSRSMDFITLVLSFSIEPEDSIRAYSVMLDILLNQEQWEKSKNILNNHIHQGGEDITLSAIRFHHRMGEISKMLELIRGLYSSSPFLSYETELNLFHELKTLTTAESSSSNPAAFYISNPHGKEIIKTFELIIDSKDRFNMSGHGTRSRQLFEKLYTRMGEAASEELSVAAHLHDIGKVRLPLSLLSRVEHLDREDKERIMYHPIAGHHILDDMNLDGAANVVLHHHERYDGGGYPSALKDFSNDISSLFLCSSFDAMVQPGTMRRHTIRFDDAVSFVKDQAGKAYHPDLVDHFLSIVS